MSKDLLGLEGKNALVTGAGRGSGRAIALTLARAGANVAVLDLDAPLSEGVAREIDGLGRQSLALHEDVTTETGAEAAVAATLEAFGIRVNCVGPTAIDGPSLQESLSAEHIDAMARSIPLGRVGTGEDIAGAVTLLASDLARFVTGQTLMCDGGVSCTTLRPTLAPGEARPRR